MQPAIKTARKGFRVTEDLFKAIESVGPAGSEGDFLSNDPSWAIDFAPNGSRVGLGDMMTRVRYADTLDFIANQGPDSFYYGPIAEAMVRAVQERNGTMTLEDLERYTIAIRDIAQIDYRGYRITSTPAPSSGIIALSVLKILETYDDFFAPGNFNLSTHRMDEAMRFGYGQVCHIVLCLKIDTDWLQEDQIGRSRVCRWAGYVPEEYAQGLDNRRDSEKDIRLPYKEYFRL